MGIPASFFCRRKPGNLGICFKGGGQCQGFDGGAVFRRKAGESVRRGGDNVKGFALEQSSGEKRGLLAWDNVKGSLGCRRWSP